MKFPVAVLYHNVRSAYNVGALFRTADGAGVVSVYLSGYSPRPTNRFGQPSKEIAKTALGAENTVSWQYHKNPITLLTRLSKEGWHIVGVEQDPRSISYRAFTPSRPTLFVFGNEVRGLSKELRSRCEVLIDIPMRGKKESLNVSVVSGIILYHATN